MRNISKHQMTERHDDVVLAYKGNVTHELFKNLIQLAEVKLEVIEPNLGLRRKVFSVLVEVLQNIYHHFEDQAINGKLFNISFTLKKVNSGYVIVSGNPILNNKIKKLQERIDYINNMSSHDLKVIYRKSLSDHSFSDKGGAGLGLMDMVRKSGAKVDYKFQAFNNDYSFFNLKVKVSA